MSDPSSFSLLHILIRKYNLKICFIRLFTVVSRLIWKILLNKTDPIYSHTQTTANLELDLQWTTKKNHNNSLNSWLRLRVSRNIIIEWLFHEIQHVD